MSRLLLLTFALGATGAALPSATDAQVRFRRPYTGSFGLGFGFDNDGGAGGCRDYDCGSTCYDGHGGEDFAAPWGSEVVAAQEGVVRVASDGCADNGYPGNPCGGYCGNYVQLEHADGSTTIYCHMRSGSLRVSPGARVACGQPLGASASSGSSSGPHLHFGYRNPGGGSEEVFAGACGRGTSLWVGQRGYAEAPSIECSEGTQCGDSPRTLGAIDAKYRALGGCDSFLGAPTSEEIVAPDGMGRFNRFERGAIYWTPRTGAHEVHGVIHDKWGELGREAGPLGYPVTDEGPSADGVGRYNHFELGSIHWSPATGPHEVRGAIRDAWEATGWETGPLGYPVSDEYAVPGGRRSDFEHGSILYEGETDATTVHLGTAEPADMGALPPGQSDGGLGDPGAVDGGAPSRGDGAVAGSAGEPVGAPISGGCSCSVPAGGRAGGPWRLGSVALLPMLAGIRRRRRTR